MTGRAIALGMTGIGSHLACRDEAYARNGHQSTGQRIGLGLRANLAIQSGNQLGQVAIVLILCREDLACGVREVGTGIHDDIRDLRDAQSPERQHDAKLEQQGMDLISGLHPVGMRASRSRCSAELACCSGVLTPT